MQLEFSLFCEAAEISDTGLIYMLRGGYDIVTAQKFPITMTRLTVVARVLCAPNELGPEHTFVSQAVDPAGHVIGQIVLPFTPTTYPGDANRGNKYTAKFDYDNITLPERGDYTFRFLIDGDEIGASRLETKLKG